MRDLKNFCVGDQVQISFPPYLGQKGTVTQINRDKYRDTYTVELKPGLQIIFSDCWLSLLPQEPSDLPVMTAACLSIASLIALLAWAIQSWN